MTSRMPAVPGPRRAEGVTGDAASPTAPGRAPITRDSAHQLHPVTLFWREGFTSRARPLSSGPSRDEDPARCQMITQHERPTTPCSRAIYARDAIAVVCGARVSTRKPTDSAASMVLQTDLEAASRGSGPNDIRMRS